MVYVLVVENLYRYFVIENQIVLGSSGVLYLDRSGLYQKGNMFKHSIKVPRLYKIAAKVAKDADEGIGSIKTLVYEQRKRHPNIKAIYALVTTLFQHNVEIGILLKKSQFLIKEPRADPWLTKILVVEMLWGKKLLVGNSIPEKTVRAYEQIFKAHMSNASVAAKITDSEEITMVEETDVVTENAPLLPPHTKQAARALLLLLFFSVLMFSLPFGSFFGVKYVLKDHYHIDGFTNTIWSVVAAVITVNVIIVIYAYIAYHEPEYDDEGKLIEKRDKSKLNLKQE